MHILELRAENVKRIVAVHVRPQKDLQDITGKNTHGKTSVLDCIEMALAGGKSIPERALRDGTTHGEVYIDLGDYKVTRSFTKKDSYLKVEDKSGSVQSPQKVLDGLLGKISFDPLEFSRKTPKEQARILAGVVGIDFDKIERDRKVVFDERTEAGRVNKQCDARLTAFIENHPDANTGEGKELRDAQALAENYTAANLRASKLESALQRVRRKAEEVERLRQELQTAESELDELRKLHTEADDAFRLSESVEDALAKMQSCNAHNEAVRLYQEYKTITSDAAVAREKVRVLTDTIEKLDTEKDALIAAADLPINGLTFDPDGVYYKRIPLLQCSASEQLKISTALAMRLNPEIRVILIRDGSLLDDDSVEIIKSLAKSEDFQIWREVVAPSKLPNETEEQYRARITQGGAILMVDGEIAE